MTNKIFFSILLIFNLIFAQDYAWPTDTGKHLSSNFGEFRDNHFHMGIDIRTGGSIGHPLYSASDG
jgi:murein DD-endopeptidase MepM/ murein hydrolase activator NlpD